MFLLDASRRLVTDGARPALPALSAGRAGRAACHSISFAFIQQWMYDIVTAAGFAAPDRQRLLAGLSEAVCSSTWQAPPLPAVLKGLVAAAAATPADVSALNGLLTALNGDAGNLRDGSAGWNSAIGAGYDPGRWVHADGSGVIDSCNDGRPAARAAAPQGGLTLCPAFFLLDERDRVKLSLLRQLAVPGRGTLGITANRAMLDDGSTFDYIYSSDNTFYSGAGQFLPSGKVAPSPDRIYFKDSGGGWVAANP